MIPARTIKVGKGSTIVTGMGAFVALKRLGDGRVEFEAKRDGELLRLDDHTISLMLARGELRMELPHERMPDPGGEAPAPMAGLTEREAAEACRRYGVARAFADEGSPRSKSYAEAFLKALPGDGKPGWRQLLRWTAVLAKYPDLGAFALHSRKSRRGTRGIRLDPRVERIIQEAIDKVEMQAARLTQDDVCTAVSSAIIALQEAGIRLRNPAQSTVALRIKARGSYERVLRRLGRKAAEKLLAPSGRFPQPDRPMQVAEIDHSPCDAFTWDDERKRWVAARAYMTVLIDVYSRMVLAVYISFDPPSYVSVMHCLHQAFLPKDDLLAAHGLQPGSWVCMGLVERLVMDNGREFHSQSLDRALGLLGIRSVYAEVSTPKRKPHVERMCGTINRGVCHKMAGATFSNVRQRGEVDPRTKAVHDLSFLRTRVYEFLAIYHALPHSTTGESPGSRWLEGVKRAPVTLPPNARDLRILMCPSEIRSLGKNGVQIDRLDYWAPALTAMLSREGVERMEVEVRRNTGDVGQLWVFDARESSFVLAGCTEPEYAAGLPLFVHQARLKERNDAVAGGRRDPEMVKAKDEFRKKVTSGHPKPRRRKPGPPDAGELGRVLAGTLKAVASGGPGGSCPAYAVPARLPGEARITADGWPDSAVPERPPPGAASVASGAPPPGPPAAPKPARRARASKPRRTPPPPSAAEADWETETFAPVVRRPHASQEKSR